uniref:ATP synthase F0 subunit 8 n=1 Tax=Chiropsalmus quadrumanus TaxID=645347 RepID=G9IT38_9CNID|nr:ATP synthase F0 subunit 8 [Chiropsalmus quadrumanus]
MPQLDVVTYLSQYVWLLLGMLLILVYVGSGMIIRLIIASKLRVSLSGESSTDNKPTSSYSSTLRKLFL